MYYTYMWLREDGTPYYVGKGLKDRAYVKHNTRWGVVYNPPSKERIVIYPAESEADALDTEVALIWYYGRKSLGTGILRNIADGGETTPTRASVAWSLKNLSVIKERGKLTGHLASVGITPEEKREQGLKGSRIALSRTTFEQRSAFNSRAGAASAAKRTFVKSLHVRWHANRGINKPGCPCCDEKN